MLKSSLKICKIQKNVVPLHPLTRNRNAHSALRARETGSGFSAVGSAHVWGARGRWFESSNPDQKEKELKPLVPTPFFFYQINDESTRQLYPVTRQLFPTLATAIPVLY